MREIKKSRKRSPNNKALAGKIDLPKMKISMHLKRWFSVREASFYTGISARLIYQKLTDRVLRHYRVNSKIVIDRKDLDGLIMQNEVRTSEELLKQLKEKRR